MRGIHYMNRIMKESENLLKTIVNYIPLIENLNSASLRKRHI